MLANVRSGRADLAVGVLDVLPDDLDTTLVASYPPTLVLPNAHPLASRDTLTVRDLEGLAVVLPPAHRPHRIAMERALRAAGVWRSVLDGTGTGALAIGSRTPVAGTPAWVTLEVTHGGFATGRALAEVPSPLPSAGDDERPLCHPQRSWCVNR